MVITERRINLFKSMLEMYRNDHRDYKVSDAEKIFVDSFVAWLEITKTARETRIRLRKEKKSLKVKEVKKNGK
jgi:hypothetical protein